jgi:Histidine kinase-like ATPase domain
MGRACSVVQLDVGRRVGRASLCPPGGPRGSRGEGGREGGCADDWAAVQETVTLAGLAERARLARAFVAAVLGPGHPCTDDAVLLVSEMFGNSVRHSRSGAPGKTITVAVKTGSGVVRVEVIDRSGPGCRS